MLTYDEAKKELSEYRDNIRYIEEKENDMLELKAKIESVTKRLSAMPKGKGKNERYHLENYLDKLESLEDEYCKRLNTLLAKKFIIEDKIERLETPYKTVLFLRYIRGIKPRDMGIGYSERHIIRLINEGIEMYSKF